MARPHYSDGRPCDCEDKFSDNPSEYVRNHPNKREYGMTFVESITLAIKERI